MNEGVLDEKAFEKVIPFLIQQCYGPLINVDPHDPKSPISAQLPWESYVSNEWGGHMEVKEGRAVIEGRLFGSFNAVPMSVQNARIQKVAKSKSWDTRARISPSKISKTSELSEEQCIQIAQECIDAERKFLKDFLQGAWDDKWNIGELRKQENLAYIWIETIGMIMSQPIDWLMALPHGQAVVHYLDECIGKVGMEDQELLDGYVRRQGELAGIKLKEIEGLDTKDKNDRQWLESQWMDFMMRPGQWGGVGCAAILEKIAQNIKEPMEEHEILVNNWQQVHKVIDALTQIKGRLWMVKDRYGVRHEVNAATSRGLGAFLQLIRKEPIPIDTIMNEQVRWDFGIVGDSGAGMTALPLVCIKKSAQVHAGLKNIERELEQLEKEERAEQGNTKNGQNASDALVEKSKKHKEWENKKNQLEQEHNQWVKRAVRLVSLQVHQWKSAKMAQASMVFTNCAHELPAECNEKLGTVIRKRTREIKYIIAKWGIQERGKGGAMGLGHMSKTLMDALPMPVLFGMLSTSACGGKLFECIDQYVQNERLDQKGRWVPYQTDMSGCSKGLQQMVEYAKKNAEPSGTEHWELNKKQWLQLMVALAVKGADEKRLKKYLLDDALEGASIKECLDYANERSLVDALVLLEYEIEKPKFEWMRNWMKQQGVQEDKLKQMVKQRSGSEAFVDMLEGWASKVKGAQLKKAVLEHEKKMGKRTKSKGKPMKL